MNAAVLQQKKRRNMWHSLLLLMAMLLLFMLLGRVLFGPGGGVLLLFGTLLLVAFMPRASAWLTLRLYRAQPIHSAQAPGLFRMVDALRRKAGLAEMPMLFLVPSSTPNAFAMLHGDHTLIAVTDGLFRLLDKRQLAGVLAHEISHIRHGDLSVMQLADLLTRLTATLSDVGWLTLLLWLPFSLLAGMSMPWFAILLLLAVPLLSSLLQLALSRTREFDADLGAVELTGDAEGLATALLRIEQGTTPWWQWLLLPGRQRAAPSLLRTHPLVSERVQRLQEVAVRRPQVSMTWFADDEHEPFMQSPVIGTPRRWRGFGIWY